MALSWQNKNLLGKIQLLKTFSTQDHQMLAFERRKVGNVLEGLRTSAFENDMSYSTINGQESLKKMHVFGSRIFSVISFLG